VAYNSPVFIIVSRYDRLGPYFSLYDLFCAVLALSVSFDRIKVKTPSKRESSQKWPITIQYETLQRDMMNNCDIRHSISNSDQLSTRAPEKATNG